MITLSLSWIFCDVILHGIVAWCVVSLLTLKVHLHLLGLLLSSLGPSGLNLLIGDLPPIYAYLMHSSFILRHF